MYRSVHTRYDAQLHHRLAGRIPGPSRLLLHPVWLVVRGIAQAGHHSFGFPEATAPSSAPFELLPTKHNGTEHG